MRILYLTEDYFGSKVHNNLLTSELESNKDLEIFVFAPRRSAHYNDLSGSFKKNERLHVLAPTIDINPKVYKFDYWAKIRCKLRLLEKTVDLQSFDMIHAATLYVEGGLAYKIKKKYDVPYLLTIRGTDSIFYTQKMFYLWVRGNFIIKNAAMVYCVTNSIKDKILKSPIYYFNRKKLKKCIIRTNGVDDFWLDNLYCYLNDQQSPHRFLFIGRLDKNKNTLCLVKAIMSHNKATNDNLKITLVGGGGEEFEAILDLTHKYPDTIEYLGEIYDKNKLIEIVRSCDVFGMVSHSETFGLVYIEALTQGLPILYSLGTGFDGMYPQGYLGVGVNSRQIDSIKKGIDEIINNYTSMKRNISRTNLNCYRWADIARLIVNDYQSVVGGRKS